MQMATKKPFFLMGQLGARRQDTLVGALSCPGAGGRGGPFPTQLSQLWAGQPAHRDDVLPWDLRGPTGSQGKRNGPGLLRAQHSHRRRWQDSQ